jgi:hypothetical protein
MTTPLALIYHLRQAADRRFPRGRPPLAPSSDKRLAKLYRQIRVELVPAERDSAQEASR